MWLRTERSLHLPERRADAMSLLAGTSRARQPAGVDGLSDNPEKEPQSAPPLDGADSASHPEVEHSAAGDARGSLLAIAPEADVRAGVDLAPAPRGVSHRQRVSSGAARTGASRPAFLDLGDCEHGTRSRCWRRPSVRGLSAARLLSTSRPLGRRYCNATAGAVPPGCSFSRIRQWLSASRSWRPSST